MIKPLNLLILLLIAVLALCVFLIIKIFKLRIHLINEKKLNFRQITENILDLVFQTDLKGTIIYASSSFKILLGYEVESIIGKPIQDILNPDDNVNVENCIKEILETQNSKRTEIRYKTITGEYLWFDSICNFLYDNSGKPVSIIHGCRNITDRKMAEQILWKQTQLQNNLLSAIPALVYLKDNDLTYVEVNERMAQLLGIEKSDIIGKTDYDLFPEDMADIYYRTDVDIITFNKPIFNIEALYQSTDGRQIWLSSSKMPYFDSSGKLLGLAGVSTDITEKMKSELQMHINQFAIDNASQMVELIDKDANYLYVNNAGLNLLRTTSNNIIGKKFGELYKSSYVNEDEWKKYWQKLKTEKVLTYVNLFSYSENLDIYLESYLNYFEYKGKEYCIVYSVDITERILAEEKLKASQTRYKSIYENINDVYFETLISGEIIEISPSVERVLKYKRKKILSTSIYDYFKTPSEYEKILDNLYKKDNLSNYELGILNKEGLYINCSIMLSMLYDEAGKPLKICGTIRDITERKLAEKSLKESEERYKTIVDFSPNPVMVLKNGKFAYVNTATVNLFKFKNAEELYGLDPLDFIHKDDRKMMTERLNRLTKEISNPPVELRVILNNGEIAYTISTSISINYGGERATLIVSQDISNQKRFEKELIKAKAKAEESDRLKSAFLANMSHEIRTPLNGIMGFSDLLNKPGISQTKVSKYSQIIETSSHHLLDIINDIIDISKIEAGQVSVSREPVFLNNICNEMYDLYKVISEKKGIKIFLKKALNNEQAIILSDEMKIRQILNNLLNNALKFTHKGHINFGYILNKNYVEFYVKDTGIGIAHEDHKIIFERFRQVEIMSNRKYGGTGLGLSISKALVEMMGGKIWLDSSSGKGTTFYFSLPYLQVKQKTFQTKSSFINEPTYNWKDKTILIAEDEETNLLYIQELFDGTGIKIIFADNGKQAVELFKSNPDIDIVLLDIKMPNMDGYETLRNIKTLNSEVKIIAQSAYVMSDEKLKATHAGFDDYITKPIERVNFLNILNKFIAKIT